MNVTYSQEVWQVDVNGEIYETNFEGLVSWIGDGSLLRGDKVRRGNLRWLDAGRIPSLTTFFNAKESGQPMPQVQFSSTEGETVDHPVAGATPLLGQEGNSSLPQTFAPVTNWNVPPAQNVNQAPAYEPQNANVCVIHADAGPRYVCDTCGSLLCGACPKGYGGNVKICPMCGSMCSSIKDLQKHQATTFQYQRDMSEGFGFTDFGRALSYPFRYKASLIIGAIMFMFFTLGQAASGSGSLFMVAASIFCIMLSNMLTFGILANTVENFSQGKVGGNFMPSFDDFSIWDDVLHPFFLSIAAWVVSFGLMIAIIAGTAWYMWNTVSSAMKEQVKSVPTAMTDVKNLANSTAQIPNRQREMYEEMTYGNQDMNRFDDGRFSGSKQSNSNVNQYRGQTNQYRGQTEEDMFKDLQNQMNQARAESLKASTGAGPEMPDFGSQEVLMSLAKTIGIVIIPIFLCLIWGLFYYPAACAVAGYTRSFWATLNPMVGLDTIKRLGFDYVKILLMKLTLIIFAAIIAGILSTVFAPFDLPRMGNLPAMAIGSWVTFYCSIVFSVILGYALYKNAEKMNLFRS